jgi:hypothetical protein
MIKNKLKIGYGICRAPETCCPEPTCDYIRKDKIIKCEACGALCEHCRIKTRKERDK